MLRAHSVPIVYLCVGLGSIATFCACGGDEPRDYFPEGTSGAAGSSAGSGGAPGTSSGGGGAPATAGAGSAGIAGRTASAGASGQGAAGAAFSAGASAGGGSGGTNGGSANTGTAATGAVGPPMWQSGASDVSAFTTDVHCESVTFGKAFDAADDILAFVTPVHPGSTWTHAPLARWVEDAGPEGFTWCMREDSDYDGGHEALRLDWLAVPTSNAEVMGVRAGRQEVDGASRRACQTVSFEPAFQAVPDVHVALDFGAVGDAPRDAAALWVEEVSGSGFRACAEQLQGFDGPLAPLSFAWLAVPASFASTRFVRGRTELPAFTDVHCTTVDTACAECDHVQLGSDHRGAAPGDHDPVIVWAEDLQGGLLTLCARETSGNDFAHVAGLEVSWLLEMKKD